MDQDQMRSTGNSQAGGRDGARTKEGKRKSTHPEKSMSKETRARPGAPCVLLRVCMGEILDTTRVAQALHFTGQTGFHSLLFFDVHVTDLKSFCNFLLLVASV